MPTQEEAGKRAGSTELSQPVNRGQPRKQAAISTQTGSNEEWITPKRVCSVGSQTDTKELSTSNRYSLLDQDQDLVELPTGVDFCSCGYEPEELPDLRTLGINPRRRKRRKRPVKPEPESTPVTSSQASPHDCHPWRPYSTCYFIPGRVQGLAVQYLIDTGCTTNLLSKHVFDRLPQAIRATLQKDSGPHGTMADGTTLELYGVIELPCRLRDKALTVTFVVSRLGEDAILGMPFLVDHDCEMEFGRPVLKMRGQALKCTDKRGNNLTSNVQVMKSTRIPARTELTVVCRLTHRNAATIGVVEGSREDLPVAACVSKPDGQGQVLLRCMNVSATPLELKSGEVVASYTGLESSDIYSAWDAKTSLMETRVDLVAAMQAEKHSVSSNPLIPTHLQDLYKQAAQNCTLPEQQKQICQLLREFGDVFSKGDDDMGLTHLTKHEIPVHRDARPLRQPARRLGPEKEAEVERQIQDLLQKGLIEPASGAWSSPVVLVKKKDGSWRFCIDYRQLNAVTLQDAYPLPRIDESLDALAGSQYFSTLDLLSGYWQVPLTPDAQEKAAFVTRGGLWKWKVLPFGLTSAPATFQRLMEKVCHGLHWRTLLLYLDDVIVIAPDFQTHMDRLRQVFQRFRAANLKLKPSKCSLLQNEVRYLGHVVSKDGVSTDPDKVSAVAEWPVPKCLTELQAFLGTVGYYRQYIEGFANLAKPLTRLTGKDNPWCWDEATQAAFEQLKEKLVQAPILQYPDCSKPYILDTDASLEGYGAVLSQEVDGQEKVVAYYSKTFTPPERNYCVTRRELLAVIKAVKHFRPYLFGRKFRLRTDHASLIWLCKRTEPSCQVARWLEVLSEFHYSIEHRPGRLHGNADGLSRRAGTPCRQCLNIEQRDGGPTMAEVQAQFKDQTLECIQGRLVEIQGTAAVRISTRAAEGDQELVEMQSVLPGPVSTMYKVVQSGGSLSEAELQQADWELKQWHERKEALRIRADGVMVVHLGTPGRQREVVACPSALRQKVIWDTHQIAHQGIVKTTARIRLQWYWPGLTGEVRRTVRTCEKCQMGKHGKATTTTGRRRLHAGRPWQVVAVDLVGPMPRTPRGNSWILVLTDHFTRWQDAIAIRDATAPTVARTLDERVFSYFGLPETIHTDQGAQFESDLLANLCRMWKVQKSRTTAYHPESNGVVERGNRALGDSLRTLLLGCDQEEWDLLLPQVMRAFRGTPHSSTGETANYLMLGREVKLPDQLVAPTPPPESRDQYTVDLHERLQTAHQLVRTQQRDVRSTDSEEPPLFKVGDLVLLANKRRRKGQCPKLQPKYVGPYTVLEAYPNHTYKIEQNGQTSVQNERRLKLHTASNCPAGQAPTLNEPRRRPNMRGATRQVAEEEDETENPALELLSEIARQILPTVTPTAPAVENTASSSAENDNNSSENNNFVNNNENIGADLQDLPVDTPPVEQTVVESTREKSVTTPVAETRSKREIRRPKYLADYQCDVVTAKPESDADRNRLCSIDSSRQLEVAGTDSSMDCAFAISELAALVRELQGLVRNEVTTGSYHVITPAVKSTSDNALLPQGTSFLVQRPSRQEARNKVLSPYRFNIAVDLPLSRMARTLPDAGNTELLLDDPLLDVALHTEDSQDDWLSKEVALLGLVDNEDSSKSTLPSITNNADKPLPVVSAPPSASKIISEDSDNSKIADSVDNNNAASTSRNNSTELTDNNKTTSVAPVLNCNLLTVEREEGELMEVEPTTGDDRQTSWITDSTKRHINRAMGRDYKKTCKECQHISPSVRRHKEHCRSHYLAFVCPCGNASRTKEVIRKHQIRAEKRHDDSPCTQGLLYTVDEASFAAWKQTTGVALPSYPKRQPKQQKKKTTTKKKQQPVRQSTPPATVRAVITPPRQTDSRKIVGYKRPSLTVYNSKVADKAVPSQMTIVNKDKDWRRLALRSLATLRHVKNDIEQQQQELSKLKRTINEVINLIQDYDK